MHKKESAVALKNQWQTDSMKLMQCIVEANDDIEKRTELSLMVSTELMPNGRPDMRVVYSRRPMKELMHTTEDGRKAMHKMLFTLIMNFNSSLNIIRPMNSGQAIDTATMLLDECDDLRIEDYVIMFTMAKRGKLIKILDRIDIQIVGQLASNYKANREIELERIELEEHRKRKLDENFIPEPVTPAEIEASNRFNKILEILKQAPGYEATPLGERVKEELETKGHSTNERMSAIRHMQQVQRKKMEQSKHYGKGVKIKWVANVVERRVRESTNNRGKTVKKEVNEMVGVLCTGEIVSIKGDAMEVLGYTPNGQQIKDTISLHNLSVQLIEKP